MMQFNNAFQRHYGLLRALSPVRLQETRPASSARTMKRFPSPRCASAIQIVRPSHSSAATQPYPALLRLPAMIFSTSQHLLLRLVSGIISSIPRGGLLEHQTELPPRHLMTDSANYFDIVFERRLRRPFWCAARIGDDEQDVVNLLVPEEVLGCLVGR